MSLSRTVLIGLAGSLLTACAGTPAMPETTYYRLPEPLAPTRMATPVVELPIVVEVFTADGLYSDQALIHALDAQAQQVRSYHYQLWVDPPARLLQRRLLASLRASGISRITTDSLPTRMESLRVQGRIAQLERVPSATGWDVAVVLVLRAEPSSGGRPWVIGEYHRRIAAQGDSVADSVQAIGAALDELYAEFIGDLAARARQGDGQDAVRIR